MFRLLPSILLLFLYACNQAGKPADSISDSTDETGVHASADPTVGFSEAPPFALGGCYEMTVQRDTATLQLQVRDSVVTGNLVYRWYARDGNTGTFQGVLRDSLILGDYTFESEGLTSVREVVFKIKDTTLVQAFGDLNTQNGKVVFRDRSRLQFMEKNPFVKVSCPAP